MLKFIHKHFDNPLDFLTFFEPEHNVWGKKREQFIFRGQAQENWGLNSKLSREVSNSDNKTIKQMYNYEMHILGHFIHNSRESGLELPVSYKEHYDLSLLNFNELLYVSSLGQHYGLPTRLLDWTKDRYKSLFFALDLMNKSLYSPDSNMVVWSLNTSLYLCQD